MTLIINNYFTEREGVMVVERVVNQMRCIWRETPSADVGIDGQIEYVDLNGNCTGHVVAVQVKSGASYIKKVEGGISFTPTERHASYWERFPLPVLVVIHDPATGNSYWADVRRHLRSDQNKNKTIVIPEGQVLNFANRDLLFESCGAFGIPPMTELEVVKNLIEQKNKNAIFHLSYFDIFSNGLTDIGRKLFFSLDFCMDIAEAKLAKANSPLGVGMGYQEHLFIDKYIDFITAQSLVVIDYCDYLIDRDERQMSPTMLMPLTARGRAVRDLLRKLGQSAPSCSLTENPVEMQKMPPYYLRLEANLALAEILEERLTHA
ncbi:DUF4365 domain-containing protein [Aeromonas salmonicida]|uniref:DUF4365 domain-containing protein n=1 Tax=Aeromonas salmonicida TaxID=645 RepID=A0AAX3VMK2_AERSA|nr:DUF4365 domain-containing protein [Aeromonas salmonicida]WHF34759.1 DUF4365 domain-containing protein [Aeromonas salmonicida]